MKKTNAMRIRELCIKKNWFHMGTNEAYTKLLTLADSKELDEVLDTLAQCIYWNTTDYCLYGHALDYDKDLQFIKDTIINEASYEVLD